MASRVTIKYKSPDSAEPDIELPFVTGVLSDLSGNNPGAEKAPLEEREFEDVIPKSFDGYMKKVKPGLAISVPNKIDEDPEAGDLGVSLKFNSMNDFTPTRIAEQVPALRALLEARRNLDTLRRILITRPNAREEVRKLLGDTELMELMAEKAEADARKSESGGDD
jgi:type VI secretion system protein ImpB